MPTGRRMSTWATACVGTRLGDMPPSMVPMLTVTRRKRLGTRRRRRASPISGSRAAMARVTASGAATGRRSSSFTRSSAARSRSMALTPLCTCAPCAATPRGLDLDPQQSLLAEAHDHGRADVAADVGVAARLGHVLEQIAGAERAHVLLVARQREDDLAAPGLARARRAARRPGSSRRRRPSCRRRRGRRGGRRAAPR